MLRLSLQLACGLALMASAAAGAEDDKCKAVLASGIWDIQSSSATNPFQRSFANWFCSQDYSSETDFKDRSASIGLPVEGVPLEFAGYNRERNWKSFYKSACTQPADFISQLNSSKYFAKLADSDLVNAWRVCVEDGGGKSTGLRMTVYNEEAGNLFRIDLSYKSSQSAPTESAVVKKLSVIQIDASGARGNLSCSSLDAPFDVNAGASDIMLGDNEKVSFLCIRNMCATAYIELRADRAATPTDKFTLHAMPDYGHNCVAPPLPKSCVITNVSEDKCLRCQFDISADVAEQQSQDRLCLSMPEDEPIKTEFVGAYGAADQGREVIVGLRRPFTASDGKSAPNGVHKNQKDCKVDIARATGFVVPTTKGLGSGGIEIQRCQGSDPQHRNCKLTGTLSIYVPEAQ